MRNRTLRFLSLALIATLAGSTFALAQVFPWSDPAKSPDVRAELVLAQMTQDEKIGLAHGQMPIKLNPLPTGVIPSAGYVAGIPRLGIPALKESDASLGVANARRKGDDAVALPSGLALAATWSPDIAFAGAP